METNIKKYFTNYECVCVSVTQKPHEYLLLKITPLETMSSLRQENWSLHFMSLVRFPLLISRFNNFGKPLKNYSNLPNNCVGPFNRAGGRFLRN